MGKTEICVKKFGGTSVGSVERIDSVAERILNDSKKDPRPTVIVASAMSGETNRLVDLANRTHMGYRGPAYDMLVASGEQVSIALLTMALEKKGLKAKPYLAYQLGIKTDSMYSRARIKEINTDMIMKDIQNGIIPVVAGFQGVDEFDNITTLGRGGSDTSAVALAVALKASECEIYTDVPGVFTADPRIVPKAHKIDKLCFEEMVEMASLGSKVLHIRSVEIAAKFQVKLHVRSTFELTEGTWIMNETDFDMESPVVTSVTHDTNTAIFKLAPLPGGANVLADLFTALSEKGIVVDVISQSELSQGQQLAFSVPVDDIFPTRQIVEKKFSAGLSSAGLSSKVDCSVMDDVSKVSIVGVGMRNHPGVAAKFFEVLAKHNISIHLVTTSEIKVSAIVDRKDLEVAAKALHTAFGLDATP
ncbi:MAG: aspartate kinase [Bdellovibrionota bacterium]